MQVELKCSGGGCIIAAAVIVAIVILASLAAGWAAATLYEAFTGKTIAHSILDYLRIGLALVMLAALFKPRCSCENGGKKRLELL